MSSYWEAHKTWQTNPSASLQEAERRVAQCAERQDAALYLGDLFLETLPDGVSSLTWLTELRAFGGRLINLSPLAPLSNLELLQIGSLNCPFPGLDFMARWSKLESLEVITPSGFDLKPIAQSARLKRLHISCTQARIQLSNLGALASLDAIESVSLDGARSDQFQVVTGWHKLRFLQLVRTNLTSLAGFENLKCLRYLHVRDADCTDISPLGSLATLEELTLSDIPIHDLTPLAGLPLLRRLTVSGTRVTDLSPLEKLAQCQRQFNDKRREKDRSWFESGLESLEVERSNISNVGPLAHIDGLRNLSISYTAVSSLDPLRSCKQLRSLAVAHTPVRTLGPTGSFRGLASLDASGTRLDSLQALAPAAALQYLNIADTDIADLAPIREAYECRSMNLRGSRVTSLDAILDTGSRSSQDRGDSRESLDFRDTPVATTNERFGELAKLAEQSTERYFFETRGYLREQIETRSITRRMFGWFGHHRRPSA